jgi:5-methylthioadenosine/S-adenosylhomocysteine deaminase
MQGARALADRHGVGWGMMHFASHPSRRTTDRVPLAELDALGVLTASTKLAHMVYVVDDDIALLARRGVKISHCPTAGLKHTKGLAAHGRFPEMVAAGVGVSLGGDSGNGSNHFDMLRLMYLASLVPKDARVDPGVMPPERVLEMATLHGARALGLGDEIGSLEPGKRADLIVLANDSPWAQPRYDVYSHLAYALKGSDVVTSIVNGRVLMEDGRLLTLDTAAIAARAREYRERIAARLPAR